MSNSTHEARIPAWLPGTTHALLRVITGLLFMQHGVQKLFGLLVDPTRPWGGAPPMFSQFWFAGVLECFGGALIAPRAANAPRGLPPRRRDGGRLLPGAFPAELLAGAQRRRVRGPLLLHIPASVRRGCGAVEGRRAASSGLGQGRAGKVTMAVAGP